MLATSLLWFFFAGEGRTRGDAGQAGGGAGVGGRRRQREELGLITFTLLRGQAADAAANLLIPTWTADNTPSVDLGVSTSDSWVASASVWSHPGLVQPSHGERIAASCVLVLFPDPPLPPSALATPLHAAWLSALLTSGR